jgi:hypothetical protein
MKKNFIALFTLIILFACQALSVFADGMVISRPDPYSDSWDFGDENDQQAFINFRNGLEKMIVSIKIGDNAKAGSVWLFPVPADPGKVVIDVVDELPQMNGENVSDVAKINLDNARTALFGTQIYPALTSIFGVTMGGVSEPTSDSGVMLSDSIAGGVATQSAQPDVAVYEHLDKEGMTSEIVTAKTADGLYDYLKNKGLTIEKGMIPALQNYIGQDYSFVVSWMASDQQNQSDPAGDQGQTQSDGEIKANIDYYLGQPELWGIVNSIRLKYPVLENPMDSSTAQSNASYLRSAPGAKALAELTKDIQGSPFAQTLKDRGSNPSGYLQAQTAPANSGIKGVSVIFPSKEIYFPLLPTSVYESKVVPATIKVVGFVSPQVFQNIKNFTTIGYFTNNRNGISAATKDFYGDVASDKYTKIEINAPSKYLTDDLLMINRAPLNVFLASLIADYQIVTFVILLVICSLATAFIVGLLLLRGIAGCLKKTIIFAFANCLTIIGLIVALIFESTGKQDVAAADILAKIRGKGYFWKRRTAAVLLAVSFVWLFFGILFNSLFQSISLIVPFLLLIAALELRRIRESDEIIFDDLKKMDYSTWFFMPHGQNKLLFVASFSALFLLISWLAVGLVKLIV